MIIIIGVIALTITLLDWFGIGDASFAVHAYAVLYIIGFTIVAYVINKRDAKKQKEKDTYGDPPYSKED